jgi:hypothetical protein
MIVKDRGRIIEDGTPGADAGELGDRCRQDEKRKG